jgi:hypothetical protein
MSLGECSKRPTAINEKIVESVAIQVRVACLCGAAERIVLPYLTARQTCRRCGRTYGIRSIAYTCQSNDPPTRTVNVSVGYVVSHVPEPHAQQRVM